MLSSWWRTEVRRMRQQTPELWAHISGQGCSAAHSMFVNASSTLPGSRLSSIPVLHMDLGYERPNSVWDWAPSKAVIFYSKYFIRANKRAVCLRSFDDNPHAASSPMFFCTGPSPSFPYLQSTGNSDSLVNRSYLHYSVGALAEKSSNSVVFCVYLIWDAYLI